MNTLRIQPLQITSDLMQHVMDNLKAGTQTTPFVFEDASGRQLLQAEVRVTHVGGVKMSKELFAGLASAGGAA